MSFGTEGMSFGTEACPSEREGLSFGTEGSAIAGASNARVSLPNSARLVRSLSKTPARHRRPRAAPAPSSRRPAGHSSNGEGTPALQGVSSAPSFNRGTRPGGTPVGAGRRRSSDWRRRLLLLPALLAWRAFLGRELSSSPELPSSSPQRVASHPPPTSVNRSPPSGPCSLRRAHSPGGCWVVVVAVGHAVSVSWTLFLFFVVAAPRQVCRHRRDRVARR